MPRIKGLCPAIPAEAATPAQEKVLERMVRDYLRYDFMSTQDGDD
jgi:hypothetical protein